MFFVLCSRENSTKFRYIFKALANFRQPKFRSLGEISHPLKRNFSSEREFEIFLAMETGCNENLACVAWRFWLGALNNYKAGARGQRNREEIGARSLRKTICSARWR